MTAYLLVIGDRQALGWLLTEQRMAFPGRQRSEVHALAPGDTLFLYTTRGCFKNPTRDRGRVIAAGTATTAVTELDEPVEIGQRSFPLGCAVDFPTATPRPEGVELAGLVPELESFAGMEQSWSIRLRRPLVQLTEQDARMLHRHLDTLQPQPLPQVLEPYARWWQRPG